jgi:hypothetical protein
VSSRLDHIVQALISVFDFNFIRLEVDDFIKKAEKRKTINKEEFGDITSDILAALEGKQQVAEKFHIQLTELSRQGRYEQIKERVEAAVTYFDNFLADDVIDTLMKYKEALKTRKKQRGHLKNLSELLQFVVAYQGVLQKGLQLTNQLIMK